MNLVKKWQNPDNFGKTSLYFYKNETETKVMMEEKITQKDERRGTIAELTTFRVTIPIDVLQEVLTQS